MLLNKAVLSSFKFNSPNAILLFQCAVCVVCVKLGEACGMLASPVEPFNAKLVRMWCVPAPRCAMPCYALACQPRAAESCSLRADLPSRACMPRRRGAATGLCWVQAQSIGLTACLPSSALSCGR